MIEAARLADGTSPVDNDLIAFEKSRKKEIVKSLADLAIILEKYADHDTLRIPGELNDLEDGIRELKIKIIRLPFFELPGSRRGAVRLTHGFEKKSQTCPPPQIRRAIWIRGQDQEADRQDESL